MGNILFIVIALHFVAGFGFLIYKLTGKSSDKPEQ